jgi:hypothetical protein
MNHENLGYQSGRMLEDEVLGKPKKESRENYEKFVCLIEQQSKFMDVVKVIETSQRNESINPSRYFGRKLREVIASRLQIDISDDPYYVQFFNAVGTVMDYKFGTDAFVSVREPGTKFNGRVTIDLTANSSKTSHKANVIAYFPEGSLDETDAQERIKLDQIISQTAESVCQKIEELKSNYFSKVA